MLLQIAPVLGQELLEQRTDLVTFPLELTDARLRNRERGLRRFRLLFQGEARIGGLLEHDELVALE